jgi:hypothetical protein
MKHGKKVEEDLQLGLQDLEGQGRRVPEAQGMVRNRILQEVQDEGGLRVRRPFEEQQEAQPSQPLHEIFVQAAENGEDGGEARLIVDLRLMFTY